jgi:hypothetical protein
MAQYCSPEMPECGIGELKAMLSKRGHPGGSMQSDYRNQKRRRDALRLRSGQAGATNAQLSNWN